ncbi:phosphate ABC transporter substrate-binding protein PstS [Prosthecomicrobium pneumaticum]|uniref:Phosphate-binding protein PstS n=1 Tax=Prosthecomicrobium pneumaticum TaxID=81895 RepID=A0A7W9CT37_9HYPH|nr:phosphate transport system substrate-binding protein [Prosthecomicrobium pneumaticum]
MSFFNRGGLMAALAGALALSAGSVAHAADISGAGATFPYPIYAKWADAYKKETGNGLNYQSIGSGGGIKQIKAKTVTFGASDMPLKPEELKEAGLTQFPTVMGGVVPVVNLEGIAPGQITLDGPTLAKIFLGEITSWDDAAIKALNPDVKLPSDAIAVVHRSDGSGTTFIYSNYLAQVSPDWKAKVGTNTSLEWPTGIGAKGNEGVAANVAQTAGSIGYVEYAYAKQNKLTFIKLVNAEGEAVEPTAEAFQAAAGGVDWTKAEDFYVILTNEPGAKSWPIAGATFILVYKKPDDAAATGEALKFFDWAYKNGDAMATDLAYVPLPDDLVTLIEASWAKNVLGADGKPVLAAK